jgi:hypothetical protein
MKKALGCILLLTLAFTLASAAAHKFYVAVFQLEYVPAKKQVQMTSRIFIDDLDAALSKKYGKKLYLCTTKEVADADDYLKKYLSEKINIKLNGTTAALTFLGRETEDDILICYYTLPAQTAVKSIMIDNTVLFDAYPDQQNIIHTKVNGEKKSLMLTNGSPTGTTDF